MKAFRSISALVLAFLVLFSSTSFLIGVHFCMGEVKEIAFFTKAKGCEVEKALPPCHRHMKAACCEDEAFFHEATDFNASIDHIHFEAPAPADIEQPLILIAEVIPSAPVSRIQHYNYDPPLGSPDLIIEHQVFLI